MEIGIDPVPQPLEELLNFAGSDCGDATLNLWLQQRALGNQCTGATRTFVECKADGVVMAYVALASGAVAVAASPGRFRRNMPGSDPGGCTGTSGGVPQRAGPGHRPRLAGRCPGDLSTMESMGLALPQPELDAIAEACRQHQVLRMHLFGSALRDDFDPTRSDLDLLVEFQPIEPAALVQAYFGLERQLASITGKAVDLVMADAVRNPYVRRNIEASKQLIYEA
jgi:predicted nucleotidyltransferase